MFEINLKVAVAIAKYASSTEETRYYLKGVFVEWKPDAIIVTATDGHRLITYRQETIVDEFESFIFPRDFLVKQKFGRGVEEMARIEVSKPFVGKPIQISIEWNNAKYQIEAIDGTFPDWRRLMPVNGYDVIAANFNGAYLHDFDKFAKELNLGRAVIAANGKNPALASFTDNQNVFGVLVPVRANPVTTRPEW